MTFAFVVIGAVVLSFSLRIEPGNDWFYPATLGLAVDLDDRGRSCPGPLHLGRTLRVTPRRATSPARGRS